MADIRINALATTAASTASDDFIAVDGSANGTRKLNAFSPTFGGNLTVSGTGNSSVAGTLLVATTANSSNGIIQLADHTTSAGGIGFGTDISLFRRNTNGGLALNATSGRPFLYFRNNSIDTASVGTIDGDLYVTVPTAKTIYFSTNDTTALTLFSNQNASLTGNLTVSGGQIAIAASASTPSVLVTQTDSAGYSIVRLRNTGGTAQSYDFAVGGSGTGVLSQKLYIYDNTASAIRFAIAPTTGNVLLGTNADSANGKLQLADHTTSAGGIGFGTDTSIFRTSTGRIAIDALSASTVFLELNLAGAKKGEIAADASNVYVGSAVAGLNTIIRSGAGVTALTLDSSQNATFAGTVTAQQLNAVDAAANNRSAAIIRAQNNTTYSSSVLSVQGDRTTTNSTYNLILAQNAAVTGQFIVRDSGNVLNTNNSYGAISDRKLKENIVDTAPKLAQIAKIQIRDYNLIGKTETQTGVIAQELETVFPSLVESFTDRDAEGNDLGTVTKTVKYSQLVPLLVKALQELRIDFETYKAAHP